MAFDLWRARWAVSLGVLMALGACGGDSPTGPEDGGTEPTLESITVTSNVGSVMAAGRTAAFGATATGSDGGPFSTTFTWSSSSTSTATVAPDGLVTAVSGGSTQITASSGSVSGSFSLTVVDVDLAAVSALFTDPFAVALRDAMSDAVGTTLDDLVDSCRSDVTAGNVSSLSTCVSDALATSASGGDAALLGVHALFLQQAERLLGI